MHVLYTVYIDNDNYISKSENSRNYVTSADGIGSPARPARRFRAAIVAIPTRVSFVALAMCGRTTHLPTVSDPRQA